LPAISSISGSSRAAALTSNPATCRAFAAAYNGPGYRANRYDEKLAERMAG
jgi:hypothetical protein